MTKIKKNSFIFVYQPIKDCCDIAMEILTEDEIQKRIKKYSLGDHDFAIFSGEVVKGFNNKYLTA